MSRLAGQAGSRQIVIDEVLPHAPEAVWKTLTSGDLMGRWLGMEPAGFAPVVGNRFTYRTEPAGRWDGTIQCEVLELIPNERFTYSWRSGDAGNVAYGAPLDTVVTFTLQKVEGGTRLRLVHSGFVLPRNGVAFGNMSGGWTGAVARVGEITGKRGADPAPEAG